MTTTFSPKIVTDSWIEASWGNFIEATANPDYQKGKFYYYLAINFIHLFT